MYCERATRLDTNPRQFVADSALTSVLLPSSAVSTAAAHASRDNGEAHDAATANRADDVLLAGGCLCLRRNVGESNEDAS